MGHKSDKSGVDQFGEGIIFQNSYWSLDADSVKKAYKNWAGIYDVVFGGVSAPARMQALKSVNGLPGKDVLEVGVGTGLALPHYRKDKEITGIDLSSDMLQKAKERVKREGLENVQALVEMNAEHTDFSDNSFDISVAMFVASVVPNPRDLLKELERITRPGGYILFINHFLAPKGPRRVIEKALGRSARLLGWHPDFSFERLLPGDDLKRAYIQPAQPFGLFTLVVLENLKNEA